MKFEDLRFISNLTQSGIRASVQFENGYGASIIQGPYSYGGEEGLYELAVLKDGEITYETDITDDVVGYLRPEEVSQLLERIEALPCVIETQAVYTVPGKPN